ncbi:WXG100 family type VII secretion target [Kitasatospora sp. NPDC008115]|uniref:WXG100 family type VII secretion target n=1 Tax=Kitasatospora sp. NPDC008115 TaxID=3364022 RepID=UPI0036DFD232
MPDDFRIDLARMRTVSSRLGECGNRMSSVAKRLENLGKGRQMGTARLDSACKQFEDEWHGGIGRMAKLASGLRDGLDVTLKNYRDHEQGVAKGFGAT